MSELINLLDTSPTNPEYYQFIGLDSILALVVMLFLLMFMFFLYLKVRVWVLVFSCFAFNLIFTMLSLDWGLPFTPMFQIFFALMSGLIFLITSLEAYKR